MTCITTELQLLIVLVNLFFLLLRSEEALLFPFFLEGQWKALANARLRKSVVDLGSEQRSPKG